MRAPGSAEPLIGRGAAQEAQCDFYRKLLAASFAHAKSRGSRIAEVGECGMRKDAGWPPIPPCLSPWLSLSRVLSLSLIRGFPYALWGAPLGDLGAGVLAPGGLSYIKSLNAT